MKLALSLVLLASTVGCQSSPLEKGQVSHVVLCWLKTPGDDAAAQQLIDRANTFLQIKGVLDVAAGGPVPSTRPVVDSSFDVGIVMTFRDERALARYETNPRHVRAVQEVLRPLTSRILIYDIRQ